MNANQFTELTRLAEDELTQSSQLLDTFFKEWQNLSEHPLDDFDTLQNLKLVLQYRLDTQNVLSQLHQIQKYMLQILGIEPLHSQEMNVERLSFALGDEDLHRLLSMLNHLVDSILRVLAHHVNQQTLDKKKMLERLMHRKGVQLMTQVIEKQNHFSVHLHQIKLILEDIAGAPHPGVIYDHVAALDGPVSRFHQALQHGLSLSDGIYQQLEHKNKLSVHLADTLQRPEQRLKRLHYNVTEPHLFAQRKENSPTSTLEERAAAKRLGHFFNH